MIQNNKNKREKKARKNKNNRSAQSGAQLLQQIDTFGAVRFSPRQIWPTALIATLKYQDGTTQRTNVASNYNSWRYRMNSAYDPDPALGTGSLSGFVELSTLYNNYKVLSFAVEAEVANRDTQPYNLVVCPTIKDVGLAYSGTYELGEFPRGKHRGFSAMGGMDRAKLTTKVNLPEFVGTAQYEFDPAYSAAVTTNPTTIVYMNVGFYGTVNQVNGVFSSCLCRYEILFYNRSDPLT